MCEEIKTRSKTETVLYSTNKLRKPFSEKCNELFEKERVPLVLKIAKVILIFN